MGVVLPSYLDEALDLIGVSWPNVDEDDYREMAQAMRDFSESLRNGTFDLHAAMQDMVGANEGPAVDALAAHWEMVRGKHLSGLTDIGEAAAFGLEAVAVLIEGAKLAAIVQLGILATEIVAAVAAAPVTLGLSSLGGIAGTQACRMIVKRIFKEVQQAVIDEIMSRVTAPIEEAIGAMVGDLVVQVGSNALGVQNGIDLGRTAKAGKDSMQLASAGPGGGGSGGSGGTGGAGGGSGQINVDLQSYGTLQDSLKSAGDHFDGHSMSHIGKAKTHQGRTRGKDAIANAVNGAMDKAMTGIVEGVKKASKHIGDDMKQGVKLMHDNHHQNDGKIADDLHRIHRREPNRDELRDQIGERPVYLLGDRGKIQRLTRNGPVDLTDADRDLLGVPLKLTGANNDTVPRRPRNPDNPYAWPESTPEERAARPRKASTKVPFYEDELSRATALARHEQGSYGNYTPDKNTGEPKFSSNNYAAARVEYEHEDGNTRDFILVGRSNNPVHSEKVLGIPFLQNGTGEHVKDLYTERAPCSESSDCAAWIQEWMPHVNVTHSIDYGPSAESMEQGNREVEDRLNRMYPGERPEKRSPWTNFKGLHHH
ncbi:nucleic acid/nucleotide deaminase domain-containing protein [Actinacidiphila glaucinigra]|uniref:nucleic acid/nucleotide deaminase domain-containing protein n=1 Tax=Actinacidiphila glaucinigra TaxID=235986 RepID=UPI003D921A24